MLRILLQASFVVAALNIQIPQVLGSVVNVMTGFMSGKITESFGTIIKEPALRLVRLYIAQVWWSLHLNKLLYLTNILQAVFTFGYIYLLSSVGERVAAQLRKELFASVLRQDISFFDKHRTGEIVNR